MSTNTTNSNHAVGTGERSPKKAPRGVFWEVTYKEESPIFQSWALTKDADFATEIKSNVKVTAEKDTRAVNLKKKSFETCDFNHFTLADSSFKECTFVDCRFVKSNFNHVKFSKCHFDMCHFLNVRFQNCQFLNCTFSNISASGEQLLFVNSSLLASRFVDALVTNLSALPVNTDKKFQLYKLLSTKAKIAGRILVSLRDEPEPDILSDANRSFEIAVQRRQIAEARSEERDGQLFKRSLFHRFIVRPFRFAGLGIMRIAGFFTDWGSSPMKSGWFLIGTLIIFSAIYGLAFGKSFAAAVLRALDCTFVFGYTKYPLGQEISAIDCIMFINAFAGFCWYALLIPALSKRLFR